MSVLLSFQQLTQGAKNIAVIIHQNPDGDAVGSAFAVAEALKVPAEVSIVCASDIPEIFSKVVGPMSVCQRVPEKTDCIIILDCSDPAYLGFAKKLEKLRSTVPIIIIDHHKTNGLKEKATLVIADTNASSTAEILAANAALIRPISQKSATALLMGIYTDTSGFQHPNTTSETLKQVSWLIRHGADLSKVTRTFSHCLTPVKRKLWGKMLENVQINRLQIATTQITLHDLQQLIADGEDVAGLANLLALTVEARAALVLVETKDGWRGTLRTRHTNTDLGRLARYFGGRGTKKAGGFTATNEEFSGIIK